MFNRVAQQEFVTAHNITGNMSRSRKKVPISCGAGCKSQKRGKQVCNRKFRRREHLALGSGHFERLPFQSIEIMDPWDLGGDGKCFWGFSPKEEWYRKEMRK